MDAETGAQLLARLGSKPSLESLDQNLFVDQSFPQPGDLVEFYGLSGSGKTEMLLNFISKCILPASWKNCHFGGIGTGVVFIDTEYQFSLLRLYSLLEAHVTKAISACLTGSPKTKSLENNIQSQSHLRKSLDSTGTSEVLSHDTSCDVKNVKLSRIDNATEDANLKNTSVQSKVRQQKNESTLDDTYSAENIESFIKSCLGNLLVLRCKSSQHLAVTLHSLESTFANRSDFGVIMIDTSSSFYWPDRVDAGDNASLRAVNLQQAAVALKRLLTDYHIVGFTTKYALIRSSNRAEETQYYAKSSPYHSPASADHSFPSKSKDHHREFLCRDWTKLISQRFHFKREDYSCSVTLKGESTNCIFSATKLFPNEGVPKKFLVTNAGVSYLN